jgi:hypothetical protein
MVLVTGWDASAPWTSVLFVWAKQVNTNATSAIAVKNFAVMVAD